MSAPKPRTTDSEAAFLDAYDPSAFEPLAVAVDVVLLSTHAKALQTLVVRRQEHPFKGGHALPGGFVGRAESLEVAAARVCQSKAGIEDVYLEQLFTFGAADRDPRMRVVSVAYYALIEHQRFVSLAARGPALVAGVRVPWKDEVGGPASVLDEKGRALTLAFDHATILGLAIKRLRGKLSYVPLGLALVGRDLHLARAATRARGGLGTRPEQGCLPPQDRGFGLDSPDRKIAVGGPAPTGRAVHGVGCGPRASRASVSPCWIR